MSEIIRADHSATGPSGHCPGPAVAFGGMDTAVATGAFTLAGVALGATLEWARSAIAARRSAAAERDELFAAVVAPTHGAPRHYRTGEARAA